MTDNFRIISTPAGLQRLVAGVVLALFTMAFVLSAIPSAEAASKKRKSSAANDRYASIVIDATSGEVLSHRNADKILYPASLTKMMTLLLTFEAIENGTLSLRDRIRVSQRAADQVPSKLGLKAGSTIRVEDAIYGLVTKSANDVAVALAEKVGGSEARFATLMTAKARQIGMSNTRFRNASGLHNPGQVSTARDMAKLGQYILATYPSYYRYFGTRNFRYAGKNHHNHNRLMETYRGMDGFKTGYIAASGFNLVASAKRGDRRLIGVVFGGRTASSRNEHMAELLDRAFLRKGERTAEPLVASLPQRSGDVDKAPVPGRKPIEIARVEALRNIVPSAGAEPLGKGWTSLDDMLQSETFSSLVGEGDYDPAESAEASDRQAMLTGVSEPSWSVQIGAFGSRVRTDEALRSALSSLPAPLNAAQPVIVPLKTAEGWVFRGRISGYSEEEARAACQRLKDCIPVSPQAN